MKKSDLWWIGVVFSITFAFLINTWQQEKQIDELHIVIAELNQMITKQQQMIARDEKILNALLHGTWDRDCVYEIIPGELLADGSVRESMIQHCED